MARIKDFTLTTTLASDDYLPLDGATNGTRAMLSTNLRTALGIGTGNTPTFAGVTATGEIRTANTQALVVRNAADNGAALRLTADATNNACVDAPANTELRFQVGSATKMTVGSTGNLWVEGTLASGRLDAGISTDANESALANLFNSGATTAGRISVLNFGKSLNAGGGGRLGYHSDTGTPGNAKISVYHYGDNASTQSLQVAKGGSVTVGQNLSVTGTLAAGGASHLLGSAGGGTVTLSLNAAASQLKFFVTQTGGVDRWYLGQNSTAEAGANAGSNFQLVALSDAGSTIDIPVLVARASGGSITLSRPLVVTGNVTLSGSGTHTMTGALSMTTSQGAGGAAGLPGFVSVGASGTTALPSATGAGFFLDTGTLPMKRLFYGDGTGYTLAFATRSGGTTTDRVAISDSGNLTLATNASVLTLGTAGAVTLMHASGLLTVGASTGLSLANGDLYLAAGKKVFPDGGGDTYFWESGANTLQLVTGGTGRLTVDATNTTVAGNLIVNGTAAPNVFAAAALNTGTSVSTNDAQINVGFGRSGSGNAFIDLIGDTTYTDFGLRIRRHNTGANAASSIDHRGTGAFSVNADDGGSIALNAPTTLKGTATNDNAAAGYVGEFLSATQSQVSAVALADSTGANVTSLTLTAGDWDVQGIAAFVGGSGVSVTQCGGGITTSSGVFPTPVATLVNSALTGTLTAAYPTIATRFSVASTVTIYLVAIGYFSGGTLSAYGYLRARRVR